MTELPPGRSGFFLSHLIKQRDEPPPKISKLAIAAETEEDRYDILTSVICYSCPRSDVDKMTGNLPAVIEGVMTAMTFSKREEVKAWEQEFIPCEHTLCLAQENVDNAESKGTRLLHTGQLLTDQLISYRFKPMFSMRTETKSMDLSRVWEHWLRPKPVRRQSWEFPRACSRRLDISRRCRQARFNHGRGFGRHLLLQVQ